ncbi:MAG: S1/P1 Nuclease, partial [Planctomycetota bacterium]
MDYLVTDPSFNSLSLPELLAARDLFHAHLMHKPNVVGTAVGRYLIRDTDPPAGSVGHRPSGPKTARTLENSSVRDYSWPCILVFVSQWVDETAFGSDALFSASDHVPKTIYLPDGRTVPVCVVLASVVDAESPVVNPEELRFPKKQLSCGYPVWTKVQEATHVASLGCLITDGHTVYALTNRHVAGRPGEEIF